MKPKPDSRDCEPSKRRTEGVRQRGRSARVVRAVLQATAEELGRVGFSALRVEDVAERAEVNKTTVYRRWPSKPELVRAALSHAMESPSVPDTGTLRGDVEALVSQTVEVMSTLRGRGLLRMIQNERMHPEFAEQLDSVRAEHNGVRRRVFEQAMARGEIPADSDPTLLVELLIAPLVVRLIYLGVDADPHFLRVLVDASVLTAQSGLATH